MTDLTRASLTPVLMKVAWSIVRRNIIMKNRLEASMMLRTVLNDLMAAISVVDVARLHLLIGLSSTKKPSLRGLGVG